MLTRKVVISAPCPLEAARHTSRFRL